MPFGASRGPWPPDVSIPAALIAGLISFLSPCVLPLVPPYLVYLSGAVARALADAEPEPRGAARDRDRRALLFVLGFSTVFIALGASASVDRRPVARLFRRARDVAGIAIIVMGLHFLGSDPHRFSDARKARRRWPSRSGLWGAYVMGLAFAFGWTPCIGPILAAILAVAASEATVAKGAGLLAVYSLGLGIPFLLAAFAVEPFAAFLSRFAAHLPRSKR